MNQISFALAQLNPIVGDVVGNIAKLRQAWDFAEKSGADLVVTSELFLCGYPPEDLVLKPSFQQNLRQEIEKLAAETAAKKCAILLGAPWIESNKLYNAALLLTNGVIAAKIFKRDLPNYGVFDEKRLFTSAPIQEPVAFRGVKLGVMICEDMWTPSVAQDLNKQGADILLVPNGSPFEKDKAAQRHTIASARVTETALPLIYLNQLGGQDELIFDGASFALNKDGSVATDLAAWQERTVVIHFNNGVLSCAEKNASIKPDGCADVYNALMLGLRDYVTKNSFPGIVLGMSGCIDSALAAAIAVDALGADKVWGVMMPSPYTSPESLRDAAASAHLLGCKLDRVPIDNAMRVFGDALAPIAGGKLQGIASENIQSRSRGLILMALSNACGHMVLSTGNKSEMSVGYATLYGDMCGGFAVLKDVYKTEVYKLAHWRNEHKPDAALGPAGEVMPQTVLTKAPTAELRPNQTDQDSLPPYDVSDGILESLIEHDLGINEIAAKGYETAVVKRVWALLDRAEYKRRQAPPGVKITRRTHGRDRRYPITNRYSENPPCDKK